MNRHLVLISNPGNPDDLNYVGTTENAVDRLEQFFRSPIGGYWRDDEITRFGVNRLVSANEFKRMMMALDTSQCDYSIIVFCGHGCCTVDEKDAIQLPIPNATNNNLLPVEELLGNGAQHIRRTIILDCCRSLVPFTSNQLFETRYYSSIYSIDGIECGNYYDSIIMQAEPHIEILYSTSEHQKAFGSINGSQYADAMSNLVRLKSQLWKASAINNRSGHFYYPMCDLQKDLITNLVGINIQIPEYKIVGKTNSSFPFVAMHLPTDRSIYTEDSVIEVLND